MRAINEFGSSEFTELLGSTPSPSNSKVLIVNGFDRIAGTSNSFDFILEHGDAVYANGYSFDAASNEAIINGNLNLSDYAIVDWILGEEGAATSAFDENEKNLIQDYILSGGRLFVSGSEIGYDMYEKGNNSDKLFYENVLKAEYISDAAGGTGGAYSIEGVSNSLFDGYSFNFDNGKHGNYDVDWPDGIKPYGNAVSILKYKDVDYIQTAGYVNPADVKTQVAKYDDILGLTLTNYNIGDYIWTGTGKSTTSWDVLKYTRTDFQLKSISSDTNAGTTTFALKAGQMATFAADDIIGIIDAPGAEKFYKVKECVLGTIVCYANGTTPDLDEAQDPSANFGFVTVFVSSRVASLEEANTRLINSKLRFDLLNNFCCNAITKFVFAFILFLGSSFVYIFKTPSLVFFDNFPLSLNPALILFSIVFPFSSLATPILLEKKVLESLLSPKLENKSLF